MVGVSGSEGGDSRPSFIRTDDKAEHGWLAERPKLFLSAVLRRTLDGRARGREVVDLVSARPASVGERVSKGCRLESDSWSMKFPSFGVMRIIRGSNGQF